MQTASCDVEGHIGGTMPQAPASSTRKAVNNERSIDHRSSPPTAEAKNKYLLEKDHDYILQTHQIQTNVQVSEYPSPLEPLYEHAELPCSRTTRSCHRYFQATV